MTSITPEARARLQEASIEIDEAYERLEGRDDWHVLASLSAAIDHLEAAQRDAVQLAREQGVSWEQIGRELGLSHETAWARFHTVDPSEQEINQLRAALLADR